MKPKSDIKLLFPLPRAYKTIIIYTSASSLCDLDRDPKNIDLNTPQNVGPQNAGALVLAYPQPLGW